ncbi:MAG: EamA family transporter [Mogibacterium sp.]|nr:EamA family transporter [Mogibacterium sp.]
MNERKGEFLVGLALALRASSLLFGKIAMRTMGPFLTIGLRFTIAFILIAVLFRRNLTKVDAKTLLHCAEIGIFFFLAMVFELYGLQTTPSSVTAFLEGAVVIFVPAFTCIIQRKLPDRLTVISAVIAMTGMGFLTLKGDHLGFTVGELLVLGGTVWYSLSVIVTDKAAKNDDLLTVAIYQLLFIAIFAYIGAFFFEEIRLPESGQEWGAVLALAIICSGVGFTIQPFGQKYTTPERAGILAVFNPLTAAVLGVIFLHETMTGSMIIGAVMILISILAPAWIQDRRSRTGNDAG